MFPAFAKAVTRGLMNGRYFPALNQYFYRKAAQLSPLADAFNGLTSTNQSVESSPHTGLFQNEILTAPSGFNELVLQATQQCRMLLHEAVSPNRTRKMVQVLDDMSDSLCRVADLADCIRMLHPNEAYRTAASEACQAIGLLVEELNTYPELYNASVRSAGRSDDQVQLTPDMNTDQIDRRVLDLFVADFELSGVQLQDPRKQSEFVHAAAASLAIGAEFVEASHQPAILHPSDLIAAGATEVPQFDSLLVYHPIVDDPRSAVRAATYQTYYAPVSGQEDRLVQLLQLRHRMAEAAGFVSFAGRATLHSLAETSERVGLFLDRLVDLLGPTARLMAQEHLMTLREFPGDISPQQNDDSNCTRLLPWDLPYLLGLRRSSIHHEELADYFSLGACMEGISQLADCLFGLKLHVEPIMPGEVWHPDVIKVGIYSKSHLFGSELDQPIGLVYCDLLDRPDKPAQDCHYTIQGGRQLPDGQYQIPIITLQLTLNPPSGKPAVPLLALGQVENLFHEWGHALHSMLACTRYQHVTGTRCSTDFAELPSTLFEQFALDPRVTREYVRHWSTGKAPTARDLETLKRIAVARGLGQSVELIQQSTYASLDQILHSGPPDLTMRSARRWKSDMPTSSQLLADLMERAGLSDWLACSPQQIGAWPHRFAHLVGYGGRYYAYLMARAGALLVWRNCFADNPWSSTRGQLYADKLLRLGGEFHPSTMISGLLSTCSSAYEDVTERPLTPEQLVRGLVDQVEENERSASVLLNSLHSPGLHQPGRTPRWPV